MIFLLHLILAAFLTGLTWFVALVHYPLFLRVENFSEYEREHIRRTMPITFFPMFAELVTGIWLLWEQPSGWVWMNLGGLALIWLSTFAWQVPLHFRMIQEPTMENRRRMTLSHWPRTLIWTARLILLTYYALPAFR